MTLYSSRLSIRTSPKSDPSVSMRPAGSDLSVRIPLGYLRYLVTMWCLPTYLFLLWFPFKENESRVSSKQTKKNFGSNRNKPKHNHFRFVSRNQKLFFSVCFGSFRCFGPVSKQPKQTDLFRYKPKKSKQYKRNRKPRYQTVLKKVVWKEVQYCQIKNLRDSLTKFAHTYVFGTIL
jgi:hypothetical protein